MMKLCKILPLLFWLMVTIPAAGQVDTLFWFAAPEVSYNAPTAMFDRPVLMRITTYAMPATVTISQPAGGGMPVQTITIAANSSRSVDLTPWIDFIENKPANTILNYGLKIASTSPVTVYYDVVSGGGIYTANNPEAFSLKGRNALGTDFLVPAQNYINNVSFNPLPYSSFDIVATENNTLVTITPTANIAGHSAGTTFTVMLNAGQTYSATASSQLATQHLQGSRVRSDKPIAITAKEDLLEGAPFGGCADLAGDQIVPIALLGTEYIAMKGLLNAPGDQLFVTAIQNGTVVTHNGTVIATLNAGNTCQVAISTPSSYIQTNLPVSVWQLSGIGCEVGACLLPQIECTGSSSVSYFRAANTSLYFNLLVRSGGQGDFLINGVPGVINTGHFTVVPNTGGNWYTAQVTMPAGSYPQGSVINVSNSASLFHLGILEGGPTGGTSYGYFSNFMVVTANASSSQGRVCRGDSIRLFANAIQGASYQWVGPGGFSSIQQNPVIPRAKVSDSGIYTLTVNLFGCNSRTDTVHVAVVDYPDIDLGNDVTICVDSFTIRPALPPVLGASYEWSTGAVTDSLRVGSSDKYWLRVSQNGCTSSDTLGVKLNGSLSVDLGADTSVCDLDTPYMLTSVQPAGTRYLWNNGWSLSQMSVKRTGTYWLRVTHNGCTATDTIRIQIVHTPSIDIGRDTIICAQFPLRIGQMVANATYNWNTGVTEPYITVTETGQYVLTVDVGNCAVSDTADITSLPVPDINLGPDRNICPDQTLILDAEYGMGSRYLWNTGDTTAQYHAGSGGTYDVQVITAQGCVGIDTVFLKFVPLPIIRLGADTSVCEETPLSLLPYVLNADSLRWSDGSSGSTLSVVSGGVYTATAINQCGIVADTINVSQIFCDIWVPNVFTPNGDGVNDVFRVLGNVGRLQVFGLSVYNRWGQRLFHTSDRYQGWDGRQHGSEVLLGTYIYMLEYYIEGRPMMMKGSFHLIR